MDFFGLGDTISYNDYNMIVYLLRKFKRLTSDLKLGSNSIESDYGVYSVTGGLTSVGGNFILEDDVTISSNDVLLNCFYTFYFTVVDVNLSGTVNRRVISVTGDTGDDGVLEVVLEPSLLESDEVILPDFKVDIVFDEHEYYTPVSSLDITLSVDKEYITVGETATVTATVLDSTGSPVEDLELQFNFNGDVVTDVTDSSGVASAEYTGTGAGWIDVVVSSESIQFYDGYVTIAEFTGNSITLGANNNWLITNGDVVIDWGDGSTDTVNNPRTPLTHNYTDGESEHSIVFYGNVTSLERCFRSCTGLTSVTIPNSVTSLGDTCFYYCTGLTSVTIPDSVVSLGMGCFYYCTGLTSVTIPDSVVSLGDYCFDGCTGLTSVVIPNSVTSLGNYCFRLCNSLIDYQLYWTGNDIITYDSSKMQNNTDTIFTIPSGETANYTAKGYPTSKLVERGETLTLTCDKPIIQKTETSTVTATLKQSGSPLTGKTLNYQVKHGSTVISTGTKTTNSSGQATISYTGTGVGDVNVIVSYGSLVLEIYELLDCRYFDEGTSHKHNDNTWTDWSVYPVSVERKPEYTEVYSPTAGNNAFLIFPFSTYSPSIIEYDFYKNGGALNEIILQLRDSSRSILKQSSLSTWGNPSLNTWYHIKLDFDNKKMYLDDNVVEMNDISPTHLYIADYSTTDTVRYKNFKVY